MFPLLCLWIRWKYNKRELKTLSSVKRSVRFETIFLRSLRNNTHLLATQFHHRWQSLGSAKRPPHKRLYQPLLTWGCTDQNYLCHVTIALARMQAIATHTLTLTSSTSPGMGDPTEPLTPCLAFGWKCISWKTTHWLNTSPRTVQHDKALWFVQRTVNNVSSTSK